MILFDRLIHTGRVAADDRQVKPVVVFAYITVDAAGRFLEFRLGDPKVKVPIFQTDRGSTILACIGPTDTATYVLGISDKSKVELKLAARAATLRAAAETAPPEMARALEAIARFSLSPTERAAAIAAMGRKTPGPADYVSVQMVGFDLDPADRFLWRVHQRRSEENQGVGSGDGVIGDCPFCGAEDVPMTRLYGKVGGAFLIAFNEPSFEAYGRTQGYVAPSCLDCSSALGRGASWAVGNAAYRPAPMSNVTMVWWTPERAATDQPWAHWNKQWPKEGQPPSTEEALGHLPESTDLLVIEKNMGRWAVRRHGIVNRDEMLARVARWREVFGRRWMGRVVDAVFGPRTATQAQSWDLVYVAFIYHLLLGEPIPPVYLRDAARRVLAGVNPDLLTEAQREQERVLETLRLLCRYAEYDGMQIPKNGEGLTGTVRAHYLLGRAYRRAAAIQQRQSRPQIGLDAKVSMAANQLVVQVEPTIQRHIVRPMNGTMISDPLALSLLRDAALAGWTDRAPSPIERTAFLAGYQDQRRADDAAAEEWRRRKAQAAPPTPTPSES